MPETEREQTELAAAEAGAIGGETSSGSASPEHGDPAQQAPLEAGQGESEGFEQAESELIEHASHGDQHAAGRAIEDASELAEDARASAGAETDEEHSSELREGDR